jgi:hypothetical protein
MRRQTLFVDLPENRGSVSVRLSDPAEETSRSILNWIGKSQFGPWENANNNANIFRGSKSARPCTEVARGQPVTNLGWP